MSLRLGVDGGHRVVEHDHPRVRNERAREGHPLALATGEVDPALADQRVVAVRELCRELRDAGCLARSGDFVPGASGRAAVKLVAQRDREEDRRCVTIATAYRSSSSSMSRMSTPPTSTRPSVGS